MKRIALYTANNENILWIGEAESLEEAIEKHEAALYGEGGAAEAYDLDEEALEKWEAQYLGKEVPEDFDEDCTDAELHEAFEEWEAI